MIRESETEQNENPTTLNSEQLPKPLSSGSSYYHRLRVRRAKRVLDDHYKNLLVGGRLLYVKEPEQTPINPED